MNRISAQGVQYLTNALEINKVILIFSFDFLLKYKPSLFKDQGGKSGSCWILLDPVDPDESYWILVANKKVHHVEPEDPIGSTESIGSIRFHHDLPSLTEKNWILKDPTGSC